MSEQAAGGVPGWELHHRLARALEYEGVKVGEMAEFLGVATSTMTNYLSGRTTPKKATLRVWALRCGVPFDWLSTGRTSTHPDDGGPVNGEHESAWISTHAENVVSLRERSRTHAAAA